MNNKKGVRLLAQLLSTQGENNGERVAVLVLFQNDVSSVIYFQVDINEILRDLEMTIHFICNCRFASFLI